MTAKRSKRERERERERERREEKKRKEKGREEKLFETKYNIISSLLFQNSALILRLK
jgi:hypothetical protein